MLPTAYQKSRADQTVSPPLFMRLPLLSLPQSPHLLFRSSRRVCLRIARGFRRRHCIFCVCRRTGSDRCFLPARCRLSDTGIRCRICVSFSGFGSGCGSVSVYGRFRCILGLLYRGHSRVCLAGFAVDAHRRLLARPNAILPSRRTRRSPRTAYSAHGVRRRIATGCAAAGAVAWRAASVGPLCALFGFPQSDVTKLRAKYYRNLTIFDFCFLHSAVKIVYNGEKLQSHITWTFQK